MGIGNWALGIGHDSVDILTSILAALALFRAIALFWETRRSLFFGKRAIVCATIRYIRYQSVATFITCDRLFPENDRYKIVK